ncbi:hypothetical protein G6F57_012225 [Rhizopus arrhizus]|uniref:Uncharacterized protein n=1 Tax=Rhizopus oryzae TaxID=64495 RepID=A0A9P6XGK2_RHIOR|nr:hypothetical protein G6F24_011680 [Rhizopus arrhizus]KAG1403985.1 hypothetical protein G6F58_010267 [Rhizopus delemar]KAG0783080.1 hypothetical protein G6F22_008834 [Rhizopus arrhizus]KAG0785123.1 hypothetical protein G6F21_009465 [Rhizopus arrhizus]KAG0828913.1 hypothetical protein G6F19_008018 [Rhizopus arrhizus]
METSISAELSIGKTTELLKMFPKYIESQDKDQSLPRSWNPKEVIRSGIQITPHLYYNSINAPSCASPVDSMYIPENLATFWYCQVCRKVYSFRRHQAIQHMESHHQ